MLWGYIYRKSHARSACASARAREERQFPTNRTRVLFARVLARGARGPAKKHSFAKHEARRAEKGERECARWIRARPSPNMCLRQATTPTRRWKGVHAVRVLTVEGKWRGKRVALCS